MFLYSKNLEKTPKNPRKNMTLKNIEKTGFFEIHISKKKPRKNGVLKRQKKPREKSGRRLPCK